jgi:hypothetical protein
MLYCDTLPCGICDLQTGKKEIYICVCVECICLLSCCVSVTVFVMCDGWWVVVFICC